jgi:hypothetical protein
MAPITTSNAGSGAKPSVATCPPTNQPPLGRTLPITSVSRLWWVNMRPGWLPTPAPSVRRALKKKDPAPEILLAQDEEIGRLMSHF